MRVIILLILFLSACQQDKLMKKQYFIFGTIIDVLIWHDDEKQANQAFNEVENALNGMHNQWHAWKAGRLNEMNTAMRNGESFAITDDEVVFIETTKKLSKQSLENFNPAIGELIHMWGFHTDNYPITSAPPSDAKINTFLQNLPTMDDVTIVKNNISSTNQHIWLDYGGIAKGYAIDNAIDIIKKHGIKNAIVNAGGDLRSIGGKGDKNWRVAIRKPNSKDILAVISIQGDESVFTSGNYERYKEFNGKRYAHIIDPKTGKGVSQIVSATVIAANGTKADAAATAMIVAGKQSWHKVARSMQLDQVLLIDSNGECFATINIIPRLENSQLVCAILK